MTHDTSGSVLMVLHISVKVLYRPGLVQKRVISTGILSLHLTNHSGQLSLAIPPWAGAISTGNGHGHCW